MSQKAPLYTDLGQRVSDVPHLAFARSGTTINGPVQIASHRAEQLTRLFALDGSRRGEMERLNLIMHEVFDDDMPLNLPIHYTHGDLDALEDRIAADMGERVEDMRFASLEECLAACSLVRDKIRSIVLEHFDDDEEEEGIERLTAQSPTLLELNELEDICIDALEEPQRSSQEKRLYWRTTMTGCEMLFWTVFISGMAWCQHAFQMKKWQSASLICSQVLAAVRIFFLNRKLNRIGNDVEHNSSLDVPSSSLQKARSKLDEARSQLESMQISLEHYLHSDHERSENEKHAA